MIKVIYPPEQWEEYPDYTTVFLAGPIKGASNWRDKVVDKLTRLNNSNKNILIMSPNALFDFSSRFSDLKTQVEWESKHLRAADIIVFYLDKEIIGINGRSFAQTTRFELGEWMALLQTSNSQTEEMIIGYDEKFTGMEYIKLRFQESFITRPIPFHTDFDKFVEDIFDKC